MKETILPEDQAHLADETIVEGLESGRGPSPCDLGSPANDIRPVANSDFLSENPAAAELLRRARIPTEDIFAQNAKMNRGADSPEDLERQAAEWIEQNRARVDDWLAAVRAAAQG